MFRDPGVGVVVPTNPIVERAQDLAPLSFGPILQIPRGRILKIRGAVRLFKMFD